MTEEDVMNCDTYAIIDRGNVIAKGMPIETALIMLKALLLEFWREPTISYTIVREAKADAKEDAWEYKEEET